MEQKKKERDVLVVRDEKTGEIGVVSGLNGDGTPKMTPATGANQKNFLSFDKNSNVLESFFENFYRQCKEPKRFGFYRVAADNIGEVIDVFKDMLKDPIGNKELLEPHRIDTSKYEQQVQTVSDKNANEQANESSQQSEQVLTQEPVNAETKGEQAQAQNGQTAQEKPDGKMYLIDESRINWSELEIFYGVSRQGLEASGDLEKMLNGGKSGLMSVAPIIGGERFEIEARLSFKEM